MSLVDWLLVCILSLVWGGSFFFAEVALTVFGPLTVVALRVLLAALILMLFMRARGIAFPRGVAVWRDLAVMGMLNNVLPFSLIVGGQVYITSSVASIFNATTPLFTVVVAHFLTSDERMSANKVLGILLGIAGVVSMTGTAAFSGFDITNIGQFMVLGGALSYAFASIWGRRLRSLPPVSASMGMLAAASVAMVPLALIFEAPLSADPGLAPVAAVLGLASVSTAFAYLIYFRLLTSAGSTNLMLVTLLIPFSAMMLGILFLGEDPGPSAYLGLVLILSGLVAVDGRIFGVLRRA
jgi:drug/metabolite transporter (DMT)-like permease